jgi:hypothetical protein
VLIRGELHQVPRVRDKKFFEWCFKKHIKQGEEEESGFTELTFMY